MSTRSLLISVLMGLLTVPAFAQKPIHCEFLVEGKVVGLPDANLDWGSAAYALTTDAGLTFTAALSGCTDFCLDGAAYTAIQARISKNGKIIASSYASPVEAIQLILDAPAENAKIVCQEVPATPPVATETESEQVLVDMPLIERDELAPRPQLSLPSLALPILALNAPLDAPVSGAVTPRSTVCRHGGLSANLTPSFDLQPGENCLFQSAGVTMRLALEPLLNGRFRLTVVGQKSR